MCKERRCRQSGNTVMSKTRAGLDLWACTLRAEDHLHCLPQAGDPHSARRTSLCSSLLHILQAWDTPHAHVPWPEGTRSVQRQGTRLAAILLGGERSSRLTHCLSSDSFSCKTQFYFGEKDRKNVFKPDDCACPRVNE